MSTPLPAEAMERPHVIVAASVGLPDLVGLSAEAFVTDRVSVELGAGIGLLPLSVHAGGRWTALVPDGWGGHHLRVAPGATVYVFPSDPREGLGVVDVDLAWVYTGRLAGVSLGVRAGAGLAWGPGSEGAKVEPGLEIEPLRVGVVF